MGRRGPPPTPTPILKLRGSARAPAREKREPRPSKARPACPAWLDRDAKAVWKQLVPQLEEMGVLATIDRNALARYCRTWSRWKSAEVFIEQRGEVYPIKNEDGTIKYLQQFPQVSIANKLAQQLTRLEQEFGMTPSARTRLHAGVKPGAVDALAEFRAGA